MRWNPASSVTRMQGSSLRPLRFRATVRTFAVCSDLPMRRASGTPRGFTLVELLVVVAIMLIMTGLVVGVFRTTMDSDRVRSAARQVQSAVMGARDRAIHARAVGPASSAPRGLRLVHDTTDPSTVTSMVYIQPVPNQFYGHGAGHRIQFERPVNFPGDYDLGVYGTTNPWLEKNPVKAPPPPPPTPLTLDITIIHAVLLAGPPAQTIDWQNLYQLGMIYDGTRVRIPAHTGYWYTLTNTARLLTDETRLYVTAPQPLKLSAGSHGAADVTIYDSAKSRLASLEIELGTQLVPNSPPLQLPSGVAIDLINSRLPANWTPSTTAVGAGSNATTLIVADASSFRLGDTVVLTSVRNSTVPPQIVTPQTVRMGSVITSINYSSPNYTITLASPATWDAGSVVYALAARMDVMFTPQGNVIGPASAQGLIHLLLSELKDIANPFTRGPGVSVGDCLTVTIFPQTGQVTASPVDTTDIYDNSTLGAGGTPSGPRDGLADAPFTKYARAGAIAGR